jgi:carbamoyl-phosphate synthase small subunit
MIEYPRCKKGLKKRGRGLKMKPAYLILANGEVFEGKSLGKSGDIMGEVVFTNSMTGYLETLTNPSSYGKIIVQTFPLIGNYGVISEDFESSCIHAKGYIVKHECENPSNFRCEGTLHTFLLEQNVIGLQGIDTRKLTKIIRDEGTMNGMITSNKEAGLSKLAEIKKHKIENAVAEVSGKEKFEVKDGKFKVALLDLGVKKSIVTELEKRGASVTVFPHTAKVDEILAINPDGILISNGPGNPEENVEAINTIKELSTKNIPMFGICLGHLLIALAHGFQIEKLKHGHHGANYPAKDLKSGRTYMSAQSHGYAVKKNSIDSKIAKEWFVNNNDGTNEGITYKNAPISSVQFHPEASAGPLDTKFLFDEFVKSII